MPRGLTGSLREGIMAASQRQENTFMRRPFPTGPAKLGLPIRTLLVAAIATLLLSPLVVGDPFSSKPLAALHSQASTAWQDPDVAQSAHGSMGAPLSSNMLVKALAQRSARVRAVIGGAWVPLGPAPYDGSNFGFRTVSGQVDALAYSPDRSSIYAGTPDGGLWKTTDGGGTWAPIGDNFASPAVHAVAVDPAHPDTIYAGTGGPLDPHFGTVGVYKSTDGGATWTLHGGDAFQSHTSGPGAVTALVVDPTDPNRVYAAGTIGVAASTDGGMTWQGLDSPFFSVDDLIVDQHGNLYAAGGEGSLSPGVEYSADHGATWTVLSSGLPSASDVKQYGGFMKYRLALAPASAGSPRGSQILYLEIGTVATLDIYRTESGGDSWVRIGSSHGFPALPESLVGNSQGHLTISVDPSDPSRNTLFVGSIFLYETRNALSGSPIWTNVSLRSSADPTEIIHRDVWALLWVPAGSGYTLYVGCDGGVYKTSDDAQTFSDANGGLGSMQFYGGAVGPGADPSLILGASQDNGASLSSGTGWSGVVGGDIVSTAVDPQSPQIMYAMHNYGQIMKSDNGGRTWEEATNGIAPRSPALSTGDGVVPELDGARWDAPLVMDPTNPQILYAGFHHLWKSTDGGQS